MAAPLPKTFETRWDADRERWEWTVTCAYCLNPVYERGPCGRGEREAALAMVDLERRDRVLAFCSPACRDRFGDLEAFDYVAVADGVGREQLATLLPRGANGVVAWPE